MTTELKTVHSFWTPIRILDTLRGTAEELEKKGVKITPNQLAMKLIDLGLKDERLITAIIHNHDEREKVVPSGGQVSSQSPPTATAEVDDEEVVPIATTTTTTPQGINQEEVMVT
jgi:hypothetical protein